MLPLYLMRLKNGFLIAVSYRYDTPLPQRISPFSFDVIAVALWHGLIFLQKLLKGFGAPCMALCCARCLRTWRRR